MKSETIKNWWPVGQSLDIVKGNIQHVSTAIAEEVSRFISPEIPKKSWVSCESLEDLFLSVKEYSNVPTVFYAIATKSQWTVLWNNSFLCDGYDSLCYCLTKHHNFDSMHWSANDETTTFQSGASFTFRKTELDIIKERSVYCTKEDNRWLFGTNGEPLPEEDLKLYDARRKKDRLNEKVMQDFLNRCGASPWQDDYYDFTKRIFCLERVNYPETIIKRSVKDVLMTTKNITRL